MEQGRNPRKRIWHDANQAPPAIDASHLASQTGLSTLRLCFETEPTPSWLANDSSYRVANKTGELLLSEPSASFGLIRRQTVNYGVTDITCGSFRTCHDGPALS